MEDKGFKSCGVCKIVPGNEIRYCSICLEHLCDGQRNACSVCTSCIDHYGEDCIFERGEDGRLIDPEKRVPLSTCICGKKWNTICGIQGLTGDTLNHCPIGLGGAIYWGKKYNKQHVRK